MHSSRHGAGTEEKERVRRVDECVDPKQITQCDRPGSSINLASDLQATVLLEQGGGGGGGENREGTALDGCLTQSSGDG